MSSVSTALPSPPLMMWRTGCGTEILPFEIERQSNSFVWIKGHRHAKRSGYHCYYNTYERAREAVVARERLAVADEIARHINTMKYRQENLDKANAIPLAPPI